MATKKQLDGLNYRQAQKRNSETFGSLSRTEQKQIRQQGYKNLGWDNVRRAWTILQKLTSSSPVNLIEFAIEKAEANYEKAKNEGDLLEVLQSGRTLIRSLKLKYQ